MQPVSMPRSKGERLVVGNHVVRWRYRVWLILPWTISAMLLPDFWGYFSSFNASTLLPVFLFGAMWGIGNINYGLTMRYLGMSMGIGIAIGITLIVGTLMTPILNGHFDVLINTGRPDDAAGRAGGGDRRGDRHPRRPAKRTQDGHQGRRVQPEERAAAGGDVRGLLGGHVVRHERRQTDARRRCGWALTRCMLPCQATW